MKVLVVEDTEDSRILLEDQLGVEGYDVLSAVDGKEGLEKATQLLPDLIISDILMPKMDGFEFCRQLKTNPQLNDIPFIFYTATYTDSRDEALAMSLGASKFVIKPQDPVKLIEIINGVMSHVSKKNHESHQNNESSDYKHSDALMKKLEKKIQQLDTQKEQLRLITDALPAAIAELDKNYVYLYANKTLEDWFALSRNEITGRSMEEVVGKTLFEKMKPRADKVLSGNVSFEEHLTFPDGIERDIFVRYVPSFDSKGNVRGFVSLVSDISERKTLEKEKERLREQLHQSQKMDALGKLTGGIAHDFNNILGIIQGYAELLEGSLNDQPDMARYAHQIHQAGERGASLTQKLLAFSRPKSFASISLNLNTFFQNQQLMLEKLLTARIELIFKLEKDLWPVYLDSDDLENVVINISINAMHAMETNGRLTIQASNTSLNETEANILRVKAGDYVLLSISDTGIGMNETVKEKIFNPFFSTKGDKGTGLGLSQVYGFIECSNSAIKVDSQVGHGTQMSLYFPRHYENSSSEKQKKNNDIINYKGSGTILLVDDEPALLELTGQILTDHGFNVVTAENAEKALIIIEDIPVDLLITDIIMPGMGGYQLTSVVRKKYPKVKIQLISGFSSNRNIDETNKNLEQNLLYKPFGSQDLMKKIQALFNNQ